jgi:hypothetical protein
MLYHNYVARLNPLPFLRDFLMSLMYVKDINIHVPSGSISSRIPFQEIERGIYLAYLTSPSYKSSCYLIVLCSNNSLSLSCCSHNVSFFILSYKPIIIPRPPFIYEFLVLCFSIKTYKLVNRKQSTGTVNGKRI